MSTEVDAEITELLAAWCRGEDEGGAAALDAVYGELRRLAGSYLSAERPDHTLEPTALVHEAYFRLLEQRGTGWRDRHHFMACAAQAMRRILVDHARRSKAAIRGGSWQRVGLDSALELALDRPSDLLALDDALSDLAQQDRRQATIVELRFYAGFSHDDIAHCLGCSRPTVVRQWRMARSWLFSKLASDDLEMTP